MEQEIKSAEEFLNKYAPEVAKFLRVTSPSKYKAVLRAMEFYSQYTTHSKDVKPIDKVEKVCPYCNCELVGFGGECGDGSLRCMEC